MGPTDKSPKPASSQDRDNVAAKFTQIREEEWDLADPDLLASLAKGHRVATPVVIPEAASMTMEVTDADLLGEDVLVLSPESALVTPRSAPQPSLAERLGQIASFSDSQEHHRPTAIAPPLVWDDEETRLKTPEPGRLGQIVGGPAPEPMPSHSFEEANFEYRGPLSLEEGASLDAVLSGSQIPARSEERRSKWNISSDDEFASSNPPYDDAQPLFKANGPPSLADGVAAIAARLDERSADRQPAAGDRISQSLLRAISQSSPRSHRPQELPPEDVGDNYQTTEISPYDARDDYGYADPQDFEFDERPTALMPGVAEDDYARPADAMEHRRTTLIPAASDDDDIRPTGVLPPHVDAYVGDPLPEPYPAHSDPSATQPMDSPLDDLHALEPEVVYERGLQLHQPERGIMPGGGEPRYNRRIMVIEDSAPQYNFAQPGSELDPFQASPTIPFMNMAPDPHAPLSRPGESTPPARPPAAELEGVRSLPLHRGKIDGRLLVLHDPEGEIASRYRLLDFKLRRISETRPLRTLALTAPDAGSSTTLTAVNLALIRAESPCARVCVVDLNFRQPALHRFIGLEPSFTLSDYLAEEASLDQVLVKLEGAPCYLIPAGPARMPPSRLYKHPRLTELFSVLYDTFDLVIMDLPPVLPKADINQVDPLIDAIVMVVSAGRTKGPDLRRAQKTIDSDKLVGVVLDES